MYYDINYNIINVCKLKLPTVNKYKKNMKRTYVYEYYEFVSARTYVIFFVARKKNKMKISKFEQNLVF